MKKRRNIAAAILLASMMAVSTCAATALTAVAENTTPADSTHTGTHTHTLTIGQAAGDEATHDYKAYQIIKGNIEVVNGEALLVNMAWNETVVNPENFVKALCELNSTHFASLKVNDNYITNVNEVAKLLVSYNGDKQALAKVFNTTGVLKGGDGQKLTATPSDGTPTSYSATGLTDGWYAVIDSISTTGGDVRSANILQVVGNTTVNPKYSVPSLTKNIVEGEERVKANEASIGDIVTYEIKVPVPNMTGYNKYFYIVNDELSKGLRYVGNMEITADMADENASTYPEILTLDADGPATEKKGDYYVTADEYDEEEGTAIKIVFKDCLNTFADNAGYITIRYDAVLNENAVIGNAGNPNTANLTYSNDPNHTYEGTPATPSEPGKPDEPSGNDESVMGTTPDDEVKTFTTGLELHKVIAGGSTPLAGAKFKIEGNGVKAVLINNKIYKVDTENGTYYMLKDGTFTQTVPNDQTTAQYDSTTTKYTLVDVVDDEYSDGDESINKTAYSDSYGIIKFAGLGVGEYTITELEAPKGYNKIENPITVKIEANINQNSKKCVWSATRTDTDPDIVLSDTNENSHFDFTVENNKGTTLPSTGGIGTTIFYVVGGTLVAGAVVMLITKKRMSVSDQK